MEQLSQLKPDFSKVNGIAFRRNGATVLTPAATSTGPRNIDELPFPALEALPLEIYRHLGIAHAGLALDGVKFASFQTARGCQDKCTYCHISVEKLQSDVLGKIGNLRGFSPERVGQDVQRAVDLGVSRLFIQDDNFFYDKRRLAKLTPFMKRDGLDYAILGGANLRFLLKKNSSGAYVIDEDFTGLLKEFGLREMMLPFESSNLDIMQKYASGKYNPETMDSKAIVRNLAKKGIRLSANFMIGFPDEPWESILRTKEFARQLKSEGLDHVGFTVAVPYPGTVDFENVMRDPQTRAEFDRDPLKHTDRMYQRGRPLYKTAVSGDRIEKAVHEFWLELNDPEYTTAKLQLNVKTFA